MKIENIKKMFIRKNTFLDIYGNHTISEGEYEVSFSPFLDELKIEKIKEGLEMRECFNYDLFVIINISEEDFKIHDMDLKNPNQEYLFNQFRWLINQKIRERMIEDYFSYSSSQEGKSKASWMGSRIEWFFLQGKTKVIFYST